MPLFVFEKTDRFCHGNFYFFLPVPRMQAFERYESLDDRCSAFYMPKSFESIEMLIHSSLFRKIYDDDKKKVY